MLPELPISYPNFVADQLLTAKNLNDLFFYLDEQERGTRTNLIGIGIVCGLELVVNPIGTSITITKGCGITSEGYLVRWDDATFENYKAYDAAKELVYSPFYAAGKQRFDIDELKSNASEEGITKLSSDYLKDKVVLLFVELLELEAKNCDPESCDDKGKNTTLTIRPLIVDKKAAAYLNGGLTGGSSFSTSWAGLPEIKMPRHHLPAADINDAGDVFAGFQKVLSTGFLSQLQAQLSQAYARISPLVKDMYSSNPFVSILEDFAFINDGSLTTVQLLYMQYYYDLFSDIIYAYEELRYGGMELMSLCCPDENAFPRHLLLGIAATTIADIKSDFRQYFIPSPAVCCHGSKVTKLRVLFKRVVLLLNKFEVQNARAFSSSFIDLKNVAALRRSGNSVPIRITPSKYGDVPLSKKSIPFYYDAAAGVDKLFQYWNYELSFAGAASRNLSYQAASWANKNDYVLNPLDYDLEPYNFLRIEGHVGHSYVEALASINKIRDSKRLPFDTIALSADVITLREQMASIASSNNNTGLTGSVQTDMAMNCHFQDLEALYDTQAQELLCKLCKEMKYFYSLDNASENPQDQTPRVPLLKSCDADFRYKIDSAGDLFEQFWRSVATANYLKPDQILNAGLRKNIRQQSLKQLGASLNTKIDSPQNLLNALLYYIEKVSEILPKSLVSFDIVAFVRRYTDLITVAQILKEYGQSSQGDSTAPDGSNELPNVSEIEDAIDHLDSLIYACKDAQFSALYNDYKTRWVYLAMLQKLGYYTKMHPGIQHKAGVPMGGTFILVYHERARAKNSNKDIFSRERQSIPVEMTEDVIGFKQQKDTLQILRERNIETAGEKGDVLKDARGTVVADPNDSQKPSADTSNVIKEARERIILEAKASSEGLPYKGIQSPFISSSKTLDLKKLSAQLTKKQYGIIDKLFFKTPILQNDLDKLTAELPDKIVIADFFLPYMCCSDCPPVYFVVNETTEPDPVSPTISLKQTQFCTGDNTAYPIAVTPATTTVSGEGVKATDANFIFNPSNVSLGDGLNKTIILTATNDGQNATQSVIVFAKPIADFEIIPGSAYNLFIFNNLSKNGSDAQWDFGDGVTAKGDNPSHLFQEDGTYTVTLAVSNSICADSVNKTINVAKASINLDGKEFCNGDEKLYPISVSPLGGKLTGEGTVSDGGGLSFAPSKVAIGAASAEKKVNISYIMDNQTVGLTVTVFNKPSAAFSATDVPTGATIKSFSTSNKFTATYLWDFGDLATSVETNPVHQYKQPGSYVVTLTVTNGSCVVSSSQTVTIIQVSLSIKPDTFCSLDKGAYQIAASPAGGQFSGEGVSGAIGGGIFTPGAVKFDTKQDKKDILIGYTLGTQSAQIHATVFQTPEASFSVRPAASLPLARIFTPNAAFQPATTWDFGDGETSTDFSPTHNYKKGGQYTVILALTNGPCKASSSQTFNIIVDGPPLKDCGTVNNFLAAYSKLESINPAQYKSFRVQFSAFKDVDGFFNKLAQFATAGKNKQLDFFKEFGVAEALANWFQLLNDLILRGEVSTVALAMFKILTDLAMYIECIQDFDMDNDKNPVMLITVFKQLSEMLGGWANFVKGSDTASLQQIQSLQTDVGIAGSQMNANGEASTKKNYLNILGDINKTLLGYGK
ncbi:MAG: PKD domain-containing protein [Chitinophagaceae bacterium]